MPPRPTTHRELSPHPVQAIELPPFPHARSCDWPDLEPFRFCDVSPVAVFGLEAGRFANRTGRGAERVSNETCLRVVVAV